MRRREFLKTGIALAAATPLASRSADAFVPAHNWSNYDFGSGPPITDRLNQGPFPQYPTDAVIPTDDVVMTTTPWEQAVPNYGKGLVTYITADMGTEEIKSDNISQAIEETWFDFRWEKSFTSAQRGARSSRSRDVCNFPII